MIEEKEYMDWSRRVHADHAAQPIVMQVELTYRCPLHCLHCYSDCYNNAGSAGRELSTKDMMRLLDKLRDAGCLWLTFTGGDPMARRDFLALYEYAKRRGFILTVFTSLAALTDEILQKMVEQPPFSIEMTLNGVTEDTYERISQVKGSFRRVMRNTERVLEAGLPLKIKTLVSRNNFHEMDEIKAFVESRGLTFAASSSIFARLNGDATPGRYRLDVEEVIRMDFSEEECSPDPSAGGESDTSDVEIAPQPDRFYRCAIGNWQWHIDPYGKLVICSCVREPSHDVLTGDVGEGTRRLSGYVRSKRYTGDSRCRTCTISHLCHSCPGKAKLEVGDEEAPIPYFCELAGRQAEKSASVKRRRAR